MAIDSRIIGSTGPATVQDGIGNATMRFNRNGALVVADGAPIYHEAASRNILFIGSSYTAITTGAVPSQAVSSTTTTNNPFVLWNGAGTGINASLVDLELVFVSGTFAAGVNFISTAVGQQMTTLGTDCLPMAGLYGSLAKPSSRLLYQPTLLVAPTPYVALGSNGAYVTAATQLNTTNIRLINGMFEVGQNTLASMFTSTSGAGTSPLHHLGVRWIELPS